MERRWMAKEYGTEKTKGKWGRGRLVERMVGAKGGERKRGAKKERKRTVGSYGCGVGMGRLEGWSKREFGGVARGGQGGGNTGCFIMQKLSRQLGRSGSAPLHWHRVGGGGGGGGKAVVAAAAAAK